jgi:T-complex protein 1 subunit alpha
LTVIPKQLAINGGKDASDLLAKMKTIHYKSQKSGDDKSDIQKHTGLDILRGKIRNNFNAGVFEPGVSKIKSIKYNID